MKHHSTTCTLLLLFTAFLSPAATPSDWEPAGKAEYTDGWIMPFFNITGEESRTWPVDIEKSATTQVYRIIDPYHAPGFLTAFETAPNTTVPACIIIDCTDNEFVRVEYQHIFTFATGVFSDGSEQKIYGHTRADYYESLGRTPREITRAGLNNTFTGNTITLRECLVGFTPDPADGAHTWNAGAFPTIIRLPASSISKIKTDPNNISTHRNHVTIYNLRGMRIPAPTPGAPYIERHPDGSTRKRIN